MLQAPKPETDIVAILFSNSLIQMLMSTFIIAIVGVLITKLRNFKKKLDMVDILTKAYAKFKKLSDERELKFEERLCKVENDRDSEIKELHKRIDELSREIEKVRDESTRALIDYLKANSVDRKR